MGELFPWKREEAIVKNNNVETVYDKAMEWLKKEKAIIKEADPSLHINAIHKADSVDQILFDKEISIDLFTRGRDVSVRLTVDNVINLSNRKGMYFFNFFEYFFEYVGAEVTEEILRDVYPVKGLNKMIYIQMIYVVILCSLGFLLLASYEAQPFLAIMGTLAFFTLTLIPLEPLMYAWRMKKRLYG
jgi:hypothetical protein